MQSISQTLKEQEGKFTEEVREKVEHIIKLQQQKEVLEAK
jgi:hypothetical protein